MEFFLTRTILCSHHGHHSGPLLGLFVLDNVIYRFYSSEASLVKNADADFDNVMQAQTLMTLTYAFYSDPVSFLHVHNFNHSPADFNFAELAKELGIGTDTHTL